MIPFQKLDCIKDLTSVPPFACWHVGTRLKIMNETGSVSRVGKIFSMKC